MDREIYDLKRKATKSAYYGAGIAVVALIIATIAASHFTYGKISLESIAQAQRTNAALWILDIMPFLFVIWGQRMGSDLVDKADSIIVDTTHVLWDQTKRLREQIEEEHKYDQLTQLPNAGQFLERVSEEILKASHTTNDSERLIHTISDYITKSHGSNNMAIILLDVDNFKEINGTLGSHNGDHLLQKISQKIKETFSDSDIFIARVGGDDFALLKEECNETRAFNVVEQLRKIFDQPFNLGGVSVMVEVSLGISIYPQHGDSANELLQNAEVAMYSCKKLSRNYTLYNPTLNVHNINDLILKTEIREAFENNQLCLHYQPKVNAKNHISEVEALVRWEHPEKGMIPPDKFVPMIIKKRLNGELLERILTLALKQATEWKKDNISLRIALNLTAFDLLEPNLPELIKNKLDEHGLESDVLKLEITESTLVENEELTLKTLTTFSKMGIPTSIDDFGTGYSSLAYLSSLPINEIKIDRSFVMGMGDNHRDAKIIQAIIALAHSLSLHTVAEGVEDAATMGQLRQLNCDFIQGYHISRPLEGASLTNWLKSWDESHQLLLAISKKDKK